MTTAAYRWVILAVSVFGFFPTHLHRMAFAPLIPTFVSDLGLSLQAGAVVTGAFLKDTGPMVDSRLRS